MTDSPEDIGNSRDVTVDLVLLRLYEVTTDALDVLSDVLELAGDAPVITDSPDRSEQLVAVGSTLKAIVPMAKTLLSRPLTDAERRYLPPEWR